jgi:hypothetical protein
VFRRCRSTLAGVVKVAGVVIDRCILVPDCIAHVRRATRILNPRVGWVHTGEANINRPATWPRWRDDRRSLTLSPSRLEKEEGP